MLNKYLPRKIYPELKKHLETRHITVITGMRRTGKTTLLKHILDELPSPNKLFMDLERLDNRELFSAKNYDTILLALKQRGIRADTKIYLFLDEIQLVPNIPSVIKYLYDAHDIKFIVTGSSSYYLKNLFTESLSGRKKIFELFPLDFGEFLTFKQALYRTQNFLELSFEKNEYERVYALYEEYIRFGGFPEAVLLPSLEEKKDVLHDILNSYITIDVKTLSDFKESGKLYQLLKMLASRVGAKLDYAKLSRLTGISRPTVMNYVDLFEKTYLIARVPVYTHNPDREIVKAQKLYFSDTGLLNILADVDSGTMFENAVFAQMRHIGEVRYFSLKTGREIDFILNGATALEAKENPTETDYKTLGGLASAAGLKKFRLIGRHASPSFGDYTWGGDIR